VAERVPHYDIRVGDGSVGSRPFRQAVTFPPLVGIISGRIPLTLLVRGDPEVFGQEARPLNDRRVIVRERESILTRK
jgi:hypothetical protein